MEQNPLKSSIIEIKNGVEKNLSPVFVFTDGKNKLYKQDLTDFVGNNSVATWNSSNSAKIDSRAYDILKNKFGNNKNKLDKYLKAILDFEINHSNNQLRHEKRLPIEEKILTILKESGYFT